MPGFNGTGPMGQGPMTGRGLGPCGGGRAYGRRGSGRGLGFCWRNFWGGNSTSGLSKEQEEQTLADEAKFLEEDLQSVKSRLAQLKGKK